MRAQDAFEVYSHLEAVFTAGKPPSSPEAIAAVEAARLQIDRWFYDCSKELHVRLTAGTSTDERYVASIDRNCRGLAAWMHEAAKLNPTFENGG